VSTPALPSGFYALLDDGLRPEVPLVHKAAWALEGGARVLQLRMKRTPVREALAASREVLAACRASGAVLIINDRVDLALLSEADGAHLGDEDLPVAEARRLLGPSRLVGATVRDAAGARRAAQAGADHVGLGPIFGTTTKAVAHPALGLHGLAREVALCPLPVVAIAGITVRTIAEVARAGAHAAAVAGDFLCAPDPAGQARALCAAFEAGAARRSIRGTP
jgi:thiamine-phosphate pyrophosphorylase